MEEGDQPTTSIPTTKRGAKVQPIDQATPSEAVAALKMLGYPEAAVQKVVRQLIASDPTVTVEELIRQGLKLL